jgi:hypothetical protein
VVDDTDRGHAGVPEATDAAAATGAAFDVAPELFGAATADAATADTGGGDPRLPDDTAL